MKEELEILIVEDNANDAELMMRTLKKNNLSNSIRLLEDGEEALDYIYGRGIYKDRDLSILPRIIFLDLKLPKVNGLEVLDKLKSDELTKKIPVIIVTSSREDPDIERAYALGANSYVVKPVNFDDFVKSMVQLGLYWLLVNENPKSN